MERGSGKVVPKEDSREGSKRKVGKIGYFIYQRQKDVVSIQKALK